MNAARTQSISDRPAPTPASLRPPDSREALLEIVRNQNPELQAEDAFEVPTWFTQQKEWVKDPLMSDSAVYNYPLLLRIRGPLNEGALQQSLQEIVRRHGALRSVFRIIDERLIQIVLAAQESNFTVTHLDGPPEARELEAQKAAQTEALQPFDLARGPVLRCKLMRLQTDHHILQLTTHTLVFDDWSTGVLITELSKLYSAFASGTMPPQREFPFVFGDFVRWQRQRLQGAELESHLDFWREQLGSATAFEHLPTDFARPARKAHAGARQTVTLTAAQADSLKMLSRQEQVSLFMVLLAGFKCLLHRYSGDEEIGVASCAANRPLMEVEELIGRFGNSMFLRTSLSGDPTFSELLKRVRAVTLNASSHLEVPFGMLLREIAGGNDRSGNPPFQVMFILQNAPKENWRLPGLSADWSPFDAGTSKQDLIVWLKSEPALEITLEYNTQLFGSASMSKLLGDYRAILETMSKNPKERVSNLPISAKPKPAGANPAAMIANEIIGAKDKAGIEARMTGLWENVFGIRPINITQNFFELGGDSLRAARLFAQINKAFQRALPLSALLEAPTIQQLAQMLCDQPASRSSSLVSVQPKGTRPPLFCVHGHGGEPFFCLNLSRRLGSDQPVYGLRSSGHCGEPVQHTVPEMAAHYVQAIRAVQPHGPYYLAGYCFGGMVAYEMARMLKAKGQDLALLVLFNTPAPGSLRGWPLNPSYLRGRIPHEWRKLRSNGMRSKIRIVGTKSARFARLAWGSGKAAVWRVVAKSPRPIAKPLPQEFLNVADANIAAAKAYNPGHYSGQITLFSTQEIPKLFSIDPREGWRSFVDGGIEHYAVEGDNNSLFDPVFDATLVKELKRCLERAGNPVRA